jgi:hypothetical protein
MKILALVRFGAAASVLLLSLTALAQDIIPTTGIEFPVLGKITPRSAKEIKSSPWSIGGETIDRDFTVYASYKKYLGPLGAKAIRLQAGWAKCEKKPGVYDFAWLDTIIDDARAQGVQPWVELSYGNLIYPGGGGIGLADGFPSSPDALAAWDRWVTATVQRYKDRITEWEIWNEPDIKRAGTAQADAYVDLHIRTATIIRAVQPASRILALGLAGNVAYAETVLTQLHQRGKLDLVDVVTIHGYPKNPDDTGNVDRLRAIIAKLGRPIEVRQGETGAPSKYQENFALSKLPWSETTQAKWDLRRMLAHRGKDVPMNLFTLSDMHYRNPDGSNLRMNYKGLLGTNPDQTISHVKAAYRAAQHVFSIFDGTVQRTTEFPSTSNVAAPRKLAVTGYTQGSSSRQIVALWFNDAPPVDETVTTSVDVTFSRGRFIEPVLVDLRTGVVYAIPPARWKQTSAGAEFRALPIYDSPLLIAEKAALRFGGN